MTNFLVFFSIFLAFIPTTAFANAGVPMLFIVWPAMFIALIPIILVEAYIIKKCGITLKKSIVLTAQANLASTAVGIPLAWIALVVIEIISGGGGSHGLTTFWDKIYAVTIQSPWLIPYESDLNWMIPSATLFLLMPFFFVSYWMEKIILHNRIKKCPKETVDKLCFKANIVSYLLLAAFQFGVLFNHFFLEYSYVF